MRIDLIGFGMDSPRTLTLAARRALGQAQLVLGAPRLLSLAKHLCSGPFLGAITPGEIQKILQRMNPERAAVLYSGDLGFYSGAERPVLMCVVSRGEVFAIKQLIQAVDERAFVIVGDVKEVLGEGFTQEPHP